MHPLEARTRAIALALVLMALLIPVAVRADGGVLRVRQTSGPLIISIFTAPETLRVGPADVSVIVQSSEQGRVLTDAVADILLESAALPFESRRVRATHVAASNKLATAAILDLPSPGEWTLTVFVRARGSAATVRCVLQVAPAPPRLTAVWPWLLLPPSVIALFAVNQTLKYQRASVRITPPRTQASRRLRESGNNHAVDG